LLILFEFGDFNLTGQYVPVWARGKENSGFALGSAGPDRRLDFQPDAFNRMRTSAARLPALPWRANRRSRPCGSNT